MSLAPLSAITSQMYLATISCVRKSSSNDSSPRHKPNVPHWVPFPPHFPSPQPSPNERSRLRSLALPLRSKEGGWFLSFAPCLLLKHSVSRPLPVLVHRCSNGLPRGHSRGIREPHVASFQLHDAHRPSFLLLQAETSCPFM